MISNRTSIYTGLDQHHPPRLPKGSLYVSTDTGVVYTYDNNGFATSTTQSRTGFINYADTTGEISLLADVWTDVPNNGLGGGTTKEFAPYGVENIIDTTTGYLDFRELNIGSDLLIRNNFRVKPDGNNALLQCRYLLGTGGNIELEVFSVRLDNGAGIFYQNLKEAIYFYIREDAKANPGIYQVKLSTTGTLLNNSTVIKIWNR